VYLWSTGGSGRACCTAAVLIGRLYSVSAGEALARVQYCVAARVHQVHDVHSQLTTNEACKCIHEQSHALL
jgi:hypothetical protein